MWTVIEYSQPCKRPELREVADGRGVAILTVRLTTAEARELVRRADAAGLSVSDFIRRAALDGRWA